MRIIITESQYSELKEIWFSEGTLDRFPLSDAVDVIKDQLGFSKFYSFLGDYLVKKYNVDLRDISEAKRKVKSFLGDISNSWQSGEIESDISSKKLRFLNDYKVISHIVYKFFQKNMQTQKFGDVKYMKYQRGDEIIYWFFDKGEKTFLGLIKGVYLKNSDVSSEIINKLGKKSFVVSLSTLKSDMKGRGYGKLMYLAVLDDCGSILSDTNLYPESKNIWVHALPKYVRTVGFINKDDDRLVSLSGLDDVGDDDIVRFFATNKKLDIYD